MLAAATTTHRVAVCLICYKNHKTHAMPAPLGTYSNRWSSMQGFYFLTGQIQLKLQKIIDDRPAFPKAAAFGWT